MNSFTLKKEYFEWAVRLVRRFRPEVWVVLISFSAAILSTIYAFLHKTIAVYGDAESHLNIAKRVVDSLTPGFAQLGGIWLPLPHILLMPFVYFDFLWRTGLAGSIVSGVAFIIASLYIYKLAKLLTKSSSASFLSSMVFILNPNILYLQSTPMTEMTLIVFFVLSSYFFISFLFDDKELLSLIAAAFFGFCASLSRYDGWALVAMEAGVLFLYYLPIRFNGHMLRLKEEGKKIRDRLGLLEGRLIIFCTLGFFGIALWLLWGYLILGDPLYFTHSQFSANSQQHGWLARGELPAYHNVPAALLYYFATSMENAGVVVMILALSGMFLFLSNKKIYYRSFLFLILLVPFFFNVLTLTLGQSVIFLPGVTPITFDWALFNVRYGVMMVPVFAVFVGYLFYRSKTLGRSLVVGGVILQTALFFIGFSPVLAYDDGVRGLSSQTAKMPDAQFWFAAHYDYGILLTDDFARTISLIRTPVKMKDVIYIGNKPYWDESLVEPQKYARWIIMQRNDTLWKEINEKPEVNARLYQYFNKVYTSDDILIFRRIDN